MRAKIAHVIGHYQPELGYEEYYLARYQHELGHDITVVTSNRISPEYGLSLPENRRPENKGTGFSVERGTNVVRLPLIAERHGQTVLLGLGRALKAIRPDIVHCHGIFSPLAVQCAITKSRLDYKLVYDSHAVWDAFKINTFLKRAYLWVYQRYISRLISSRADAIIAVTDETRSILEVAIPNSAHWVRTVYLGADPEQFYPDARIREATRSRLGIGPDEVSVLYVGKIIPKKRVDLLVRTVVNLIPSHPNLVLTLVGQGSDEWLSPGIDKLRQDGPKSRIIRLPPVPNADLNPIYNSGDIGVWPAECSIAMLEASAAGLPIVVRSGQATAHRVKNGNGLTFDGSVSDLQRCLELLLSDKDLRTKMGKSSRELVEAELSWRASARKLLMIYEMES